MTNEPLPLASIFREIFLFLQTRSDVVLFGAHAVNAYCEPERMTQDVDLLATDGRGLAEEVRAHLGATFHVATRIREVVPDVGYRIYQVQQPKNRHLVDVRQVAHLPAHELINGVRVVAPAELVAMKAAAMAGRQHRPKGSSDLIDLQRLLLAFPDLKTDEGPVAQCLRAQGASAAAVAAWRKIVREPIEPDEDESD